jgi:uncharacterized protein
VELNSLPLFPLGTALFPQGILPLRIFEVRYLDMVNKCIKTGAPFGIVALSEGSEVRSPDQHEVFVDVGTLVTITEHASPQSGLKVITCTGQQRFRILRRERLKHGLWIADVQHIEADMAVPLPDELKVCASALRNIMDKLSAEHETALSPYLQLDQEWDDCGWVANRWCEMLPLPLKMKQQLLELDNPMIRLELVNDILTKYELV